MGEQSPRDARPMPVQEDWVSRLATRRGMTLMAVGSIALIALAAIGAWFVLSAPGPTGLGPKITAPASLEGLATEYPQLGSVLLDPKLDSVYKDFLMAFEEDGAEAAYELARVRGLLNDRDELRLTLVLDTEETIKLEQELEAQGIKVTAVGMRMMDIAIPLETLMGIMASGDVNEFLGGITELDHVVRVRAPISGVQGAEPVGTVPLTTIESLGMIGADAWQNAGYLGQGVKIGVLDGGFDGYKSLLGSDLPAQVTARSFVAGYEIDQLGEVHGTACAEIVYDIAPEAQLYLAAAQTLVETRQAVDWLLSQGVNVISNSYYWLNFPKDGSSPPAVVADQAVESGVFWAVAAGNFGYRHYRGTFTDEDGNGYHEFSPGDEMLEFTPYETVKLVLNWDDWDVGDQDYDLFVYDANGNVMASSQNTQSGPGDSMEGLVYEFSDSNPYYIAFFGKRSTRPAQFDFYINSGDIEYFSSAYSLATPADARLTFSVGAVNWQDDTLESYSSQGPTDDGRVKPDISAPARVYSMAYGGKPFPGTSAAAPHVAGAAALILSAYPDLSPHEVAKYLIDRSLDYGPAGQDYGYGHGRLHLGEAPGFEVLPTPPIEQPTQPSPTTAPTQPGVSASPPEETAAVTQRPTLTPASGSGGSDSTSISGLTLLVCVALPALLGVGGIGMMGGVWFLSRSRQAPRRRAAPIRRRMASPAGQPQVRIQSRDLCPRCGAPHRMDAKFCQHCGLSLRWGVPDAQPPNSCPKCGATLHSQSKFCPKCGHQL